MKEACWPTVGKIEFRHVSLCYDIKLDPVVNNISFTINPGEKVKAHCLLFKISRALITLMGTGSMSPQVGEICIVLKKKWTID